MEIPELKCCADKCTEKAIILFPIGVPGVGAFPYCIKHLDSAKVALAILQQEKNTKWQLN